MVKLSPMDPLEDEQMASRESVRPDGLDHLLKGELSNRVGVDKRRVPVDVSWVPFSTEEWHDVTLANDRRSQGGPANF